ncbi:MAG TPA: hypothetical protein DD643_07730, partial [Synechococcus sp. UBA8638]|nr:hypothetical protein [Synechococcus sp. UBA8638]
MGHTCTCLIIHANMQLHAAAPLVPLLGLLHLRITFSSPVLPRCRRPDAAGSHARSFPQRQPFFRTLSPGVAVA